ncbi:MAG: hypothetical protein ACE5JN_13680, partial [Candidatus Methylomirabilia bacterium]
EEGPKEILRYPVRGHVIGWGLAFDRKFAAKVLNQKEVNGISTVEVQLSASYYNALFKEMRVRSLEHLLFSTKRTARFVWNPLERRFVLDDSGSELSREHIDGLFNDVHGGFLKHNFEELTTLAASGGDDEKAWLKEFLRLVGEENRSEGRKCRTIRKIGDLAFLKCG